MMEKLKIQMLRGFLLNADKARNEPAFIDSQVASKKKVRGKYDDGDLQQRVT
jgi:hypothetical protein